MNDDLATLLRKRKQLKEEQEVRKIEMQKYCPMEIKKFYGRLEDWLSDLIEENMILTSYEDIKVDGQKLGVYYAMRFKIKAKLF
ncbi:MAG TPA: hypothetical protein DCZ10_13830 [Pelotomaculum sp.]|nr:hypothetical protein [Pelotomaculum sp.]